MARCCLDAARYGDTHGLHLDNYREIWPYRDWVITAFLRNLPYDQFIRLQIAGDLIGDEKHDVVATGFFALGPSYHSDGGVPAAPSRVPQDRLGSCLGVCSRKLSSQ